MAEAHRDEIAKLEALYASNPEGRVFTHLAEAYRKAGEPARARDILNEGMRRHPDSASAFVVLGRVLSDSGDTEGGFEAFRRALELDAGNLVALRWCGDLAMRVGRVDDALRYYHELMARDPSDANLRERVAIVEADRAAEMSVVRASPPDEAPSELSLEHEPVEDTGAAGALQDFDPTDLPGDLAAFAGRQIESRGGKAWDPSVSSDDLALQQADDEMFADGEMLDISGFETNDLDLSAFESTSDDAGAAFLDTGLLETTDLNPTDLEGTDTDFDGGFELNVADAEATEPGIPALDELAPAFDEPVTAFEEPVDRAAAETPTTWQDDDAATEGAEPALAEPAADSSEEYAWNPSETEAAEGALPEPASAAELGELDPGGFGDAVGPSYASAEDDDEAGGAAGLMPVAPVTETMAELYRNQGFPERAADVYRQLLRERGSDVRLEERLAEIEAELATPSAVTADGDMILDQDESGEMWLREAESPWMAAEPAGAPHDSPYTLGAETDEPATPHAPIASYFQSLLQWRPRVETSAAPEASVEPASAASAPADEAAAHDAGAAEVYDDVLLLDDATGGEDPWSASAGDLSTSHAAPSPPAELMPWESPVEPAAPAAPPAPVTPPPAAVSTEELMPWETAPAAAAPAMESGAGAPGAQPASDASADSGVGSFASWYDQEAGTGGGHPAGSDMSAEDSGEDEEELEVFRSWLQSLKK